MEYTETVKRLAKQYEQLANTVKNIGILIVTCFVINTIITVALFLAIIKNQ